MKITGMNDCTSVVAEIKLFNAISGWLSVRKYIVQEGFSSVSAMTSIMDIDAEWPFTGRNKFFLYF